MREIDDLKKAILDLNPNIVAKASDTELENLEYLLRNKYSLIKKVRDDRLRYKHHNKK